jgi:hypothetical protein
MDGYVILGVVIMLISIAGLILLLDGLFDEN